MFAMIAKRIDDLVKVMNAKRTSGIMTLWYLVRLGPLPTISV
jgi:hypothetical protein